MKGVACRGVHRTGKRSSQYDLSRLQGHVLRIQPVDRSRCFHRFMGGCPAVTGDRPENHRILVRTDAPEHARALRWNSSGQAPSCGQTPYGRRSAEFSTLTIIPARARRTDQERAFQLWWNVTSGMFDVSGQPGGDASKPRP